MTKNISVWNQKFNEYIKVGKNIDSKKINAKFQNGIICNYTAKKCLMKIQLLI